MSQFEVDELDRCEDDSDAQWMHRAIELAKRGQGSVEPNPMVGCVLVRDGKLIGEGFHQRFGGPHAEVEALQACDDAVASTAYVTLEPCCHHGKTPPCSEALIRAGVRRVVIASADPFPKVDGGGIQQLREAGITVDVGIGKRAAEFVLAPYFKRIRTGLPWTIAKWAMSIDGKIATASGHSRWITGKESREDVHRVRGRIDAILTGMGTVEADDPMLTARPPGLRIAKRVVVCRRRLPRPDCRLLQTIDAAPTILSVPNSLVATASQLQAQTGCAVITPNAEQDGNDEPDLLHHTLEQLSRSQATNCILECGGTLMSRFFEQNLIDEFHVYIGSQAIGGAAAPGPIGGRGLDRLEDGNPLIPFEMIQLGRDIKISYRK